ALRALRSGRDLARPVTRHLRTARTGEGLARGGIREQRVARRAAHLAETELSRERVRMAPLGGEEGRDVFAHHRGHVLAAKTEVSGPSVLMSEAGAAAIDGDEEALRRLRVEQESALEDAILDHARLRNRTHPPPRGLV